MKEKDYKILAELRKNSRAQLKEISKNTSLPISTIYERIKNNYSNIVKKHTSILNFELLGFNAKANICLKCDKKYKNELYEHLKNHPNINSLSKINNGFDCMVEAIFKNVKELEEFVENLEEKYCIKSKQIYYIIDEIVKEKFFTEQSTNKVFLFEKLT
jgi:DNA-binding Lrp family transcriptional regulator